MKTIINLTGHPVTVSGTTIPSSGQVRLDLETLDRGDMLTQYGRLPLHHKVYSSLFVPEKKKDTIYLVSKMICDKNPKRKDMYIISDTISDASGKIIGCKALHQNPHIYS